MLQTPILTGMAYLKVMNLILELIHSTPTPMATSSLTVMRTMMAMVTPTLKN